MLQKKGNNAPNVAPSNPRIPEDFIGAIPCSRPEANINRITENSAKNSI